MSLWSVVTLKWTRLWSEKKKPALSSVGYEGVTFHGDDEIQCVMKSLGGKGRIVDQTEAIHTQPKCRAMHNLHMDQSREKAEAMPGSYKLV